MNRSLTIDDRRNTLLRFSCFSLLFSFTISGLWAAPTITSVANAASNYTFNSPIAQGAVFVIKGSGLGPANISVASAPFQSTSLSGTSVSVTVGSTTINAPMYYTSDGQVAALLPSNTPVEGYNSDWKLDHTARFASLEKPTETMKAYKVPVAPMLGCVGVAAQNMSYRSGYLANFGGNMQYRELRKGVTVYLPVFAPGALLFVGDGHAARGAGDRHSRNCKWADESGAGAESDAADSAAGARRAGQAVVFNEVKGAAGLMQLIPATALNLGITNRFEIEQNIRAGVAYLRPTFAR